MLEKSSLSEPLIDRSFAAARLVQMARVDLSHRGDARWPGGDDHGPPVAGFLFGAERPFLVPSPAISPDFSYRV
jgi:hypothetical protein